MRCRKPKVEEFFDSLVPSRAEELLAAGDELSLREAAELEPRRADIAVALARKRLERGAEEDALDAVESHEGDFAAEGIVARIELVKTAWQAGPSRRSIGASAPPPSMRCSTRWRRVDEETRERLRRAAVGILSEFDPGDPEAIRYRRRLATALS